MIHNLTGGGGTTPVSTNAQNHAGTNNFRRQNTVDSATIRENTARLAQGGAPTTSSSRPAALKNQNITGLDSSGAPSKTGGKRWFAKMTNIFINELCKYPCLHYI